MGLIVRLEGAGSDIIEKRLIDWELIDDDGTSSDMITINMDAEKMTNIPESGREFKVYIADVYRGTFQIADISESYFDPTVSITMTSGKFTVADISALREDKTRTFKDTTLGDVVREVMSPHGYDVKVEPFFESIPIPHVNQEQENDDAFISRLVERHDAVSKPIDNKYIVAKAGNTKLFSGDDMPPIVIEHGEILSGDLDHPSKRVFKGVKANWQTVETGLSGEVVVGVAPFKTIKTQFKTEEEARDRATGELYRVVRKGQSMSLEIQGRGDVFAESILSISDPINLRFGGDWSTDRVTMKGKRDSFSVSIQLTRPNKGSL